MMSLVVSSLGLLYTVLGVFAVILVPLALLALSPRRRDRPRLISSHC